METSSGLECSFCSEYLTGAIFLCDGGHSFCAHCSKKLNECMVCNKPLGSARNHGLEKVISKIQLPCRYMDEGCGVNMKLADLKMHHKTCPHRMYACQMEGCYWSGRKHEILTHVQEVHKNCYTENNWTTSWNTNRQKDKVMLIRMNGEIFFVHQKFEGQTLYWAAQYIGTPEEIKNYRCNVTIGLDSDVGLSITDKCFSDLQRIEEVIDENACIHLPLSLLKRCIDPSTREVRFNVSIVDIRYSGTSTAITQRENATLTKSNGTHRCPFDNCTWIGPVCDILDHVKSKHPKNHIYSNKWDIEDGHKNKTMLIETDSALFYAYQIVGNQGVFRTVQYLGDPELAKKYSYKLFHDLRQGTERHCQSISVNINDIMKGTNYSYLSFAENNAAKLFTLCIFES